jgi:hypothetical protein
MAPKSDIPGSMMEGLQALLPDIAVIMATPDADMDFLDKLQKIVLLRIHKPAPQPPGGPPGAGGPGAAAPGGPSSPGGAAPPPGITGAGAPGGPPGGGAPNQQMPSMGAPEAPTQPGGVSKPMTPNPDEMRRVLAESAGQ